MINIIDPIATTIAKTLLRAYRNGPKFIKTGIIVNIILTFIVLMLAVLIVVFKMDSTTMQGIAISLGIIAFSGYIFLYTFELLQEEEKQKEKVVTVEKRARENPAEPTAAWDLATIKLESYLNKNIRQVQWIFFLTLTVMLFGFVILSYGIIKAYNQQQVSNVTILTSVTGILTQFIGATFLIIYKSTMKQAKDNIEVLERINAVGMSMQILESITNQDLQLQNTTRAGLAKQLLKMYNTPRKP